MRKKIIAIVTSLALLIGTLQPLSVSAKTADDSDKLFSGKTISVMGDSISTYIGWSDSMPITDESCEYRYGEPYYGPVGSDCHNEELVVEDTWWHQAATELGAEILVSNAGNSTGLFHASYPSNLEWQQYLQDMLAYKSRPYYLGTEDKDPDIIALYIGSNDVGKGAIESFGSVDDVDFDALITENEDGTYTYAEPTTVAEAYCILLHKITVTYPKAEIYCFAVVPNSGGYLSTCNRRLDSVYPFNEMVRGVAAHYDAAVVELLEAFELDPDGDTEVTQEDLDRFKSFFNGDPHPNAEGFDVITECFVDTVLENSKYVAQVETKAGLKETIKVKVSEKGKKVFREAKKYLTENGMTVDFKSTEDKSNKPEYTYSESYTSKNKKDKYEANGGREKTVKKAAPKTSVDVYEEGNSDEETDIEVTPNIAYGNDVGVISKTGDIKDGEDDGVYKYEIKSVLKQGSVTAKTNEASTSEKKSKIVTDDQRYIKNNTFAEEGNDLVMGYETIPLPQTPEEVPEITDGYEYVYLGSDQFSHFYACHLHTTPATATEEPAWEDGDTKLYTRRNKNIFIDRGLVVPNVYLQDRTVAKECPGIWSTIQVFTLSDSEANVLSAYCADKRTPATEGFCYNIINLEDATYYTQNEAEMIRTVVNNGYWGTDSGFGSLETLKSNLEKTGKFSEEELDGVTDGVAMTATQYAIWSFSNYMDEFEFVSAFYYDEEYDEYDPVPCTEIDREYSAALIMKLYHYFIGLDPTPIESAEKNTLNTIINDTHFIEEVELSITGKPKNHPNNKDEDDTNDVYTVDLSFALEVEPVEGNNDDLVMRLENSAGEKIAEGRVAGAAEKDEIQLNIDENGNYVFEGLMVEEGVQDIRFVLEGVQNLECSPNLFISEDRDGETSQTMVGLAGGVHNVNVAMDLNYNVEIEDELMCIEKFWRFEKEKPTDEEDPSEGTDPSDSTDPKEPANKKPTDKKKDKTVATSTNQETTETVETVQTGDEGVPPMCFFLLILSIGIMVAAVMYRRKKLTE